LEIIGKIDWLAMLFAGLILIVGYYLFKWWDSKITPSPKCHQCGNYMNYDDNSETLCNDCYIKSLEKKIEQNELNKFKF
jgi:hypothetical protein